MTLLEFMKILFLENRDSIELAIKNGHVSGYFNLDHFIGRDEGCWSISYGHSGNLHIGLYFISGITLVNLIPHASIEIEMYPDLSKTTNVEVNVYDNDNDNQIYFNVDLVDIDESYACLMYPILRKQVLDDIDIDFFRKNIRR